MGCTSSAQNMAPSLADSEKDQNMLEELDEIQKNEAKEVPHTKISETFGIKVLSQCDNLDEPSHLDSHSKFVDTSNTDLSDSHANGHIKESENIDTNHINDFEERISHLEEVVEKVVELYENGELVIPTEPEHESEDAQTKTAQGDKNLNGEEKQDVIEPQEADVEAEEAASPSQSQCSRATRWEALADIAAELPPSLAVDPVTGQIYALSK